LVPSYQSTAGRDVLPTGVGNFRVVTGVPGKLRVLLSGIGSPRVASAISWGAVSAARPSMGTGEVHRNPKVAFRIVAARVGM
jgi:hypothetical protein